MDNQSPKLSLKDTVYQQLIELICQGKLLPETRSRQVSSKNL